MRLVLHIGTEKTGTTTIQSFLYQNRAALLKHGLGLFDVLGKPTNRRLPAFFCPAETFDDYFEDLEIKTIAGKTAHFSSFEKDFDEELSALAPSADTAIVSSEHLHSRLRDVDSIRRLKGFLDRRFSPIQVVCYFREQSAVVKSLYSTSITLGNTGTFADWVSQSNFSGHYYNYHESFSKWREVFGRESLTPRIYSLPDFPRNDVRRDFLGLVDGGLDPDHWDYGAADENRSLGLVGLELGRINNRVNKRYRSDGSLNERREQVSESIRRSALAHRGTLSHPLARDIYEACSASNVMFAREFLGTDENPFPPPTAGGSEGLSELDEDLLEEFLDFFATVMKALQD